mmetsp:Transcript_72642/g.224641  ORF Transcript_72642/g.224641 Transcript_72642/m.224641 type:complete len:230 (+) Transcript_72642:306-995(+)
MGTSSPGSTRSNNGPGRSKPGPSTRTQPGFSTRPSSSTHSPPAGPVQVWPVVRSVEPTLRLILMILGPAGPCVPGFFTRGPCTTRYSQAWGGWGTSGASGTAGGSSSQAASAGACAAHHAASSAEACTCHSSSGAAGAQMMRFSMSQPMTASSLSGRAPSTMAASAKSSTCIVPVGSSRASASLRSHTVEPAGRAFTIGGSESSASRCTLTVSSSPIWRWRRPADQRPG